MGIFKEILSAIPNKITYNSKPFISGTIIKAVYLNGIKDKQPLILILYSGRQIKRKNGPPIHYTHGINLNMLHPYELDNMARLIVTLSKASFPINMIHFYQFLKTNHSTIVKKAYRTYFTSYLTSPAVVSQGFFRYPVPIVPYRNTFIYNLNLELGAGDILNKNSIKGEENIRNFIQNVLDKATNTIKGNVRNFIQNVLGKTTNTIKGNNNDKRT